MGLEGLKIVVCMIWILMAGMILISWSACFGFSGLNYLDLVVWICGFNGLDDLERLV